jgi:hypothetical protein
MIHLPAYTCNGDVAPSRRAARRELALAIIHV